VIERKRPLLITASRTRVATSEPDSVYEDSPIPIANMLAVMNPLARATFSVSLIARPHSHLRAGSVS
jgi:hypothetical protein